MKNKTTSINCSIGFNIETLRLQSALVYDGIVLLAETFKQLGVEQIQPTSIYCVGNGSMWENGLSISNFMRNVNFPLTVWQVVQLLKLLKNNNSSSRLQSME